MSTVDPRIACRFGVRCYQKNPEHHKKYKHPPKRITSQNASGENESQTKRRKTFAPNDQCCARDKHQKCVATVSRNIAKFSSNTSDSDDDSNHMHVIAEEATQKLNEERPHRCHLNSQQFIKDKFLVDMPADFYQFWEFCKRLQDDDPCAALQDADLYLVGPFDALNGKFASCTQEFSVDDFLLHWRYYFDPPEFQTVLKGNEKSGYHIGYFRDHPDQDPVFVACNSAQRDGLITPIGQNIFAAVCFYLQEQEKICNPFQRLKISNLLKTVRKEAEALQYVCVKRSDDMRIREKKVVAKTFNKVGLVVPFDKKTELGYRDLYMDEKELGKILQTIKDVNDPQAQESMFEKLQPLFTYTSIAIDECDFGTGVQLGWDLLFYGIDALNTTTARFLRTSYDLLERHAFARIICAHMNNRRRGCKLSIL